VWVLDAESNYTMSTPVAAPTPEIAKAQELCQKADDQKKQFTEFQVTLSTLEVEMTQEDSLLKICLEAHEFGSAGDKLRKSQPARQQTIKKLDLEFKGLLTTQDQISSNAVSLAQSLTGELKELKETSSKQLTAEKLKRGVDQAKHTTAMEKQGQKHTEAAALKDKTHAAATEAAKASHDASHKEKDEKHKENNKKVETKHKADVKLVKDALYQAEDEHTQKISKMVTVNQVFLDEVRIFVKAVKDVVLKRKDYEGVFVQMETSIKEIDAELQKFSDSATGPKDAHLAPAPQKSKSHR